MSDGVEARLQALEAKVDALAKRNETLEQQTEWLEEQLKDARTEIGYLEDRLDEYEETAELLQSVERSSSRKPAERAAVLIRTLHDRAESNGDRASITARGALDVLRLDPGKRTLMYSTFERAVELVNDESVLWYREEPRSSDKKSRLVLDITGGEVRTAAEGHRLTSKGE